MLMNTMRTITREKMVARFEMQYEVEILTTDSSWIELIRIADIGNLYEVYFEMSRDGSMYGYRVTEKQMFELLKYESAGKYMNYIKKNHIERYGRI